MFVWLFVIRCALLWSVCLFLVMFVWLCARVCVCGLNVCVCDGLCDVVRLCLLVRASVLFVLHCVMLYVLLLCPFVCVCE